MLGRGDEEALYMYVIEKNISYVPSLSLKPSILPFNRKCFPMLYNLHVH